MLGALMLASQQVFSIWQIQTSLHDVAVSGVWSPDDMT
jgi:hypothetical protein